MVTLLFAQAVFTFQLKQNITGIIIKKNELFLRKQQRHIYTGILILKETQS
jgi:hypothetical protein